MALLLLTSSVAGREWDEQLYRQIEQSIQTPQIEGSDYDITKFGAKTSATAAQNQKAIQKAIDKCSKKGGGRVIIPAGQTFKTGAIQLKSHVNLHVEEGAVLLLPLRLQTSPSPARALLMAAVLTTPGGLGAESQSSVGRRACPANRMKMHVRVC